MAGGPWPKLKEERFELIKEWLTEDSNCFVLVRCGLPSDQGEMKVDFATDGDPDLAEFLLHQAQEYMEEQDHSMEMPN